MSLASAAAMEPFPQSASHLSEQLLEAIEERIVTGEYPPGARLDEVELAEAFGVSRTPIREALIRLGSIHMIEKMPRKGWAVARSRRAASVRCSNSWPNWRRCADDSPPPRHAVPGSKTAGGP